MNSFLSKFPRMSEHTENVYRNKLSFGNATVFWCSSLLQTSSEMAITIITTLLFFCCCHLHGNHGNETTTKHCHQDSIPCSTYNSFVVRALCKFQSHFLLIQMTPRTFTRVTLKNLTTFRVFICVVFKSTFP